jgi:hypothetical protein
MRGRIAVGVALALAASACAASEVVAHQLSGRGGGSWKGGGHRMVSKPITRTFPAHSLQGPHVRHRRFTGGAFGFYGVVASPGIVYAPPVGYVDSPVYFVPPAAAAPPVTNVISVAPAPPAPPIPPPPSVVEYSTGRYELRGDGTATPYVWVWVPNPPAEPPPAAVSTEPPASAGPPARRRQELYRWTDEHGVLHLTDRWEIVPPEHRDRARPPS